MGSSMPAHQRPLKVKILQRNARHWASDQLYNGMASRPRSLSLQTVPGKLVVSTSTNSQKDAASFPLLQDDAKRKVR